MAGPNTTGKPNVQDYNIGRGIVYLAKLSTLGVPLAWRDVGNAPDFNFSVTSDTLEHESSREGLKVVDKEVVIKQSVGLTFSLDEINDENLADFLSANQAVHTNVAIAGFTVRVMVPDGELALGRWYDITNAAGERAYDVLAANLTVTTNEGSPVAMVLGTDYELDIEMGRIFVLSTSTVAATSITAGKGLKVTLTARAGANVVDEVKALTRTSVVVAVKFISTNPADDGRRREFQFHRVTLKANGDFGMISDDWSKMTYEGKAERNTGADADSPTMTIRTVRPD